MRLVTGGIAFARRRNFAFADDIAGNTSWKNRHDGVTVSKAHVALPLVRATAIVPEERFPSTWNINILHVEYQPLRLYGRGNVPR